jgi:lipoprotein-anchoring transpeptidase ErfK/SrfK
LIGKRIVILVIGIAAAALIVFAAYQIFASLKGLPKVAMGDDQKAVASLREIAERDPGSRKAEKALCRLASIYERRGNLVGARDVYQKLIDIYPDSKDVAKAEARRAELNIKLLFSPLLTDDSIEYNIQRGDTLSKIARRFGTTVDLIVRANGLTSTNIMAGHPLKVQKARMSILVDKSQNTLTLKTDNRIIKTYRVSTGANNSTPVGTFKITDKLKDPVWYTTGAVVPPGSPKNILGTRWLGISKESYGIHGTTDPGAIGKSVTSGCVRMTNPEAEELYVIVPEGMEVVIVD